jgi:hypothetical protein
MSISMIAATYTYQTSVAERVDTLGGMDSELTGREILKEYRRTIVVPTSLADLLILHDISEHGDLIGEVEKRRIAMTYPAPHYWG